MTRPTLLVALVATAACGASERPSAGLDQPDPESDPSDRHYPSSPPDPEGSGGDEMQIEGLKGKLEPFEIEDGIRPHQQGLSNCYHARLRSVRFLSGKVQLKVWVSPEGTVRAAQVTESSLGAWPVEQCLLEIVRSMTFAKPKGGEADFSFPLDFDSGRGYVTWWDEEIADSEVADSLEELEACAREAGVEEPRNVTVTLYLGRRGKVQSVGFSAEGDRPPADAWADCAEEKILAWGLTDPRGKVVKFSFRFRPE